MSKSETEGCVITIVEGKIAEPKMYNVVLLNDDYTTMDFVVEILQDVFAKSFQDANEIMLAVHHTGRGICGTYSLEIAEAKQMVVHQRAQSAGFPLKCIIEDC